MRPLNPRTWPRWLRPVATLAGVAVAAWLVLWACTAPVGQPLPPPIPKAAGPIPSVGQGESLRDLAKRASAEGQVRVAWDQPLSDEWRSRFEGAFQQEFGIGVSLAIDQKKPDVIIGSDATYALLMQQGSLTHHDWAALFGAPKAAILFDGGAVTFAQDVLRPAYGVGVQPGHAWQDLLDSRLKGRIGVASAADVWARLSFVWGPEKTDQFVQALAQQQPTRGAEVDLASQLSQGGILALAAAPASLVDGLNGVVQPDVDVPVIRPEVAGPLKDAAHPEAAALFTGFLLTQEGQQLWQQYRHETSMYVNGSPLASYLVGKRYAAVDQAFAGKELPARTAAYAKMLGYSAAG